jgi:hypothetical protein
VRTVNLSVALLFLALGIYLLISAGQFPAGMGRLPGPGFFPGFVGAVVLILSLVLLAGAIREKERAEFRLDNAGALACTIVLLVVYLLLWGRVSFALRTALLLILFLRLLGERWRSTLAVAVILTVAVLLAFQYGLRVDLQ